MSKKNKNNKNNKKNNKNNKNKTSGSDTVLTAVQVAVPVAVPAAVSATVSAEDVLNEWLDDVLSLKEVVAHRKRNDLNSTVESNNPSELIRYFSTNGAVSWNEDDRDSHYKVVIEKPWWKALAPANRWWKFYDNQLKLFKGRHSLLQVSDV